jgi:hypothetical protein
MSLIKKSLFIASFSLLQPVLGADIQSSTSFSENIVKEKENIKQLRNLLKKEAEQELEALKEYYYPLDPVRQKAYWENSFQLTKEQVNFCKTLDPKNVKIFDEVLTLLEQHGPKQRGEYKPYEEFDDSLTFIMANILNQSYPTIAQALQNFIIYKNNLNINYTDNSLISSLRFRSNYKKFLRNYLNIINKTETDLVKNLQNTESI